MLEGFGRGPAGGEAQIAADLVSRACLRERISKVRPQPLILHANNGNAVAAGFRAAIAGGDAGEPAGGAGSAQILLQAKGEQRQPLLGVVVPYREIPAGLPEASFPDRRGGLRLGGGIRGLVQPPASPQRHPVCDAIPATQRRSRCNQPTAGPRLRAGTSTSSAPLEPVNPLLASAGGGLDQSAASGQKPNSGYVDNGCLTGSRGVIFPGSHRACCHRCWWRNASRW
jgi:hypothetical protein